MNDNEIWILQNVERFQIRFFKKIRHTPDCWQWKAGKHSNGYGAIRALNKMVQAHRAVWILTFGRIPKGLCVLHKCDNRACVNPDHLFIGTKKDNAIDMSKKGRCANQKPNTAPAGERHGRSKITWEQSIEIRRLAKNSILTHREIAKRYKLGRSTVQSIIYRKSWLRRR